VRATRAETVALTNERAARESQAQADEERDAAKTAREELRRALYASHLNLIQAAWEENNIDRGRELLDDPLLSTGKADLRGFEWHYWRRRYGAGFRTATLPGTPLRCVFHPDGKRIAGLYRQVDVPARRALCAIRVCDARTGQVVWQTSFGVSYPVSYLTGRRKKQGLPELIVLTALAMSGRLDSNQRPPEPHSGGRRRCRRKNKPVLTLWCPCFLYFRDRVPQIPAFTRDLLHTPAGLKNLESLFSSASPFATPGSLC
jgi:hypothetical protein